MKLPAAENAFVDMAKLEGYCLSHQHAEGRHKARVFQSVLGLGVKDAAYLRRAIIKAAIEVDATLTTVDEYGSRYLLDFEMAIGEKRAIIRTGWIVRAGEDFPRMTTCYVL
jgi:hypothetical protein